MKTVKKSKSPVQTRNEGTDFRQEEDGNDVEDGVMGRWMIYRRMDDDDIRQDM